jgi:hypothetical protein
MSGLSPREVRGQDFSTYVMALYEPSAGAPRGAGAGARAGAAEAARYETPAPLRLPVRVAVAQVGEVAPPQDVLDVLRRDPGAFASVQPIPGATESHGDYPYAAARATDPAGQVRRAAREHIDRMRRYARDLGAEYLFLYGGTIDHATTGTPLGAADLTIVGAFLVPSKRIAGVARASGALVDVNSGRVVVSVSADAQDTRLAPSFSRETGELKMLQTLRDDVVVKLAEQLAARVKAEASLGG